MSQSKHPRLCSPRVMPGCKTVFFTVCFTRVLEDNGYLCWSIQHSAELVVSHQQGKAEMFNTGTANRDVRRLEVLTGKEGSVHTNRLQVPHLGTYNLLPRQLMDRSGGSCICNGLQITLNSLHPLCSRSQLNAEQKKESCMWKGLYLAVFKPFVRNWVRGMKTKKIGRYCICVASPELKCRRADGQCE